MDFFVDIRLDLVGRFYPHAWCRTRPLSLNSLMINGEWKYRKVQEKIKSCLKNNMIYNLSRKNRCKPPISKAE